MTSHCQTCSFVTQHIYNLSVFVESCRNHFTDPRPVFNIPWSPSLNSSNKPKSLLRRRYRCPRFVVLHFPEFWHRFRRKLRNRKKSCSIIQVLKERP
ncbi:hypothetical protein ARMGADRAFT_442865 [Armillaria gallica]|uniref:Uncharacterized protein n=1 Tax=Armillaria gallica TaxID=47427 RepID=A0A2H3D2Z7_ARMGA|nr:hypothetical protein ARMGADRAFT_442865 [Armillaria gallica]